jgi:hypothetical protein
MHSLLIVEGKHERRTLIAVTVQPKTAVSKKAIEGTLRQDTA